MNRQHKKFGKRRRLSRVVSFLFHFKRNHVWLRRLAFLWLFLVVVEIACPVLECQDLTEINSPQITATVKFYEPNSSKMVSLLSPSDNSAFAVKDSSAPEHCNDECLCHVTATLNLHFDIPKVHNDYSLPIISYDNQPEISISPPIQPPKNA